MSRVAPRRPSLSPRLGVVALACASALLASCGGGDRKSYFAPDSVVSFGDENSAIAEFAAPTLYDNNFPASTPGTLKGLSYTGKSVRRDVDFVCNDTRASTATVDYCRGNNGQSATFAPSGPATYHVLSTGFSLVIQFETGTVGSTNSLRTTLIDYACDVPSTWVQIIARAYGKGFTGACPQDTRGGAVSYAALGAKTQQVIDQINAHRSELNSKTVVTIMVGQNDILEQYAAIQASPPTQTEAGAIAELQDRANQMAAAIKGVIGTGAKVILSLTPDLGQAPLVGDLSVPANLAKSTLLTNLVRAYNDRLYITGLGNVSGRSLAGVNPESLTKPGIRNNSYQYATPLCAGTVLRPDGQPVAAVDLAATPPRTEQIVEDEKLLFCTTPYFVGSANTAIWADNKRPAPLLHNLIGATVFNRAREQF